MKTHIALDYIANDGFRNTCYQLLNEEGKSIAHLSFEGTVVTRFDCVARLTDECMAWKTKVREERPAFISFVPNFLPNFSAVHSA